jgi:hypothetical protein
MKMMKMGFSMKPIFARCGVPASMVRGSQVRTLQVRTMLTIALAIVSCVSGLGGCVGSIPLGQEKVWTSDSSRDSLLAPSVRIDDFKVRPPLYYASDSTSGGGTSKIWKDTQQVKSQQGTCPLSPGSSTMIQCETDTVPRSLEIGVDPAGKENNQQNLSDICTETLRKITLPMEIKNFTKQPVEFGTIKELRFCKAAWSAEIPRPRRLPGVSMNVPVPAQGLCYVTIAGGRMLVAQATVPKGDPALGTLEQSMLSIESSVAPGTGGGSAAASVTSPRQLFDTFKRLDLANDPRIIDLLCGRRQHQRARHPLFACRVCGVYRRQL